MKHLIFYLMAGTRGGPTRATITAAIRKRPMNAHQLAKKVELDYKTVQHHLRILEKNGILTTVNKGSYGAVYFISEMLKADMEAFDEIWKGMGND